MKAKWKIRAAKRLQRSMETDIKKEFRDAADALREEDFPITQAEAVEILTIAGFDAACVSAYRWNTTEECQQFEAEEQQAQDDWYCPYPEIGDVVLAGEI